MQLLDERNLLINFGRKLLSAQLTTGTGGNLSILNPALKLIAISPSAVAYDAMQPEDIVIVDFQGNIVEGEHKPSSELNFHLALYHKRSDIQAIVHTHSIYATTFACLNQEIPAVHYLIGFCGEKVPLAPYATFGSEALAQNTAESIGTANAVLLANHGLVAVGPDIASAFNVAEEIEMVARLYYQSLCIGKPRILNRDEMSEVIEKFEHYGKPQDIAKTN